jgi:hypothetical protein
MNNPTNLEEMFSNLSNWKTLSQLADTHPQFSYAQLKVLFWKRNEHTGLKHCVKKIGKRIYINEPAFSLWMSGRLKDRGEL